MRRSDRACCNVLRGNVVLTHQGNGDNPMTEDIQTAYRTPEELNRLADNFERIFGTMPAPCIENAVPIALRSAAELARENERLTKLLGRAVGDDLGDYQCEHGQYLTRECEECEAQWVKRHRATAVGLTR
jgi:hypothetical protein